MNQILQVQENRRKNSNPVDTKKIVLFFAVCIIIFGLIYLGQGAYNTYQNKANQKVNPNKDENVENPEYEPTITLTQTEEKKVILKVESEITISHIIYSWNNEVAQTIDETGKTNVEEIIDIPSGENVLNISVIDSNGKETKTSRTYIIEEEKPTIELSVIGNNIKISVTSKVDLSYITYKWNSEAEKKQDMLTYENKTSFTKELEIPKGQNTLKIVAVDINNNKSEKSQEIKGIAKLADPKVTSKDGYIYFTFEAEDNMQLVEITFNNETFYMDTETFGQTKIVKYRLQLVEGMNYLKLIGTTEAGAKNTTVWKKEYKVQQ